MKSADVLTWNGCLNDAVHYLKDAARAFVGQFLKGVV